MEQVTGEYRLDPFRFGGATTALASWIVLMDRADAQRELPTLAQKCLNRARESRNRSARATISPASAGPTNAIRSVQCQRAGSTAP
ncbi:MAG: hypothetical protein IPL59_26560 [Candidatus Competibacteraceae bacterium]|nr:hypothetical protein [Candidatus Competibacteraceae bacterium]